jgi:hypothetical protein
MAFSAKGVAYWASKPAFYLVFDAHCRVLSPPNIVAFPFKFTPHIALRAP